MEEYVRKGRSLRSVAADHGLTVAELRDLVVSYGLPLHHGVPPAPTGTDALTRDYLEAEYVAAGRSAAEIASSVGVSEQSVLRYLHRHEIPVRQRAATGLGQLLTAEFLQAEYVAAGRSAADIAASVGVSEQSVLRYLHRHEIPLRSVKREHLGQVLTADYLRREYVEAQRSVASIAAEHDVSEQAVRNWLKRHEIPLARTRVASAADRLTLAYLRREYERKGRTVREIANEAGVSEQSVLRYLHRHEIPVRRGRAVPEREPQPKSKGPGRPAWLDGVLTAEYLQRHYVEEGRSAAQIAASAGVSEQSVLRYLHRHGIEVRPVASGLEVVFTPEYLRREYVEAQRSLSDIGREHGVSGETVRKWLVRHGISRRTTIAAPGISRELLEQRYLVEQRSIASIASELGVSATTVTKHLGRHGIVRDDRLTAKPELTREVLEREYVQRGRTLAEVGAQFGVSATTVRRHLERLGIEIRSRNAKPLLERVLSREYLEREYVQRARTARDLAAEIGVSEQTVLRYLHRHGLPVRPAGFGSAAGVVSSRPGAGPSSTGDAPEPDRRRLQPGTRPWASAPSPDETNRRPQIDLGDLSGVDVEMSAEEEAALRAWLSRRDPETPADI
jgi:predicted transcriptional regulator/DNA-binding phage protein